MTTRTLLFFFLYALVISGNAQSYLAQHRFHSNQPALSGQAGPASWSRYGEQLLQTGVVQLQGFPTARPFMLHTDMEGQVAHSYILQDPQAAPHAQFAVSHVSLLPSQSSYVGITRHESSGDDGFLLYADAPAQLAWTRRWPEVAIKDLSPDSKGGVLMLGQGHGVNGESRLEWLSYDPTSPNEPGFYWVNQGKPSGATRLVSASRTNRRWIVGWQQHLNSRHPMVIEVTDEGHMVWHRTYALPYTVTDVADATRIGEYLVIVGSALAPNQVDPFTFVLLLDERGRVLGCHSLSFPQALSGTPPLYASAVAGFASQTGRPTLLVGGKWHAEVGDSLSRSWVARLSITGQVLWARSYYAGSSDVRTSDYIGSLHADPALPEFMATGLMSRHENGALAGVELRSIRGELANGRTGESGRCSQKIELKARPAKADSYREGGLDSSSPTLPYNFYVQPVTVISSYCSSPVFRTTSVEVLPVLQERQQIEWLDLHGRVLYHTEGRIDQQPVAPSHLPKGIYVLRRLSKGRTVSVEKVTINQ